VSGALTASGILDKANEYARRVWEAAKRGIARASTGSVRHLVRTDPDGHIREWPVAELSLFDAEGNRRPANAYAVAIPVMKAIYAAAGMPLPDIAEPKAAVADGHSTAAAQDGSSGSELDIEGIEMDEKQLQEMVAKAAAEAVKAQLEAEKKRAEEERKAKEAEEERIKAEVEARLKAEREEAAKSRRLPGGAPYVTKFNDRKYDNLDADDMAMLYAILDAPTKDGIKATHTRDGRPKIENRELLLKSLALKMAEAESKGDEAAHLGLKALGLKSDEIMQQDLSSYGDEWVGVQYSTRLWEAIRQRSFVVNMLPSIEVPSGYESIVIPLESGDPTFYKVSEAADTATSGWPNATITSSQMGTASQTLSLGKMGARVLWSGELDEDSLIPFVRQLRTQLEKAGAEQMEHAIIDGDTDTSATTNVNDIGGTPAGTELYLICDGFRKLPLITNTANAVSVGTLTAESFLSITKLMGAAGKNASQLDQVGIIIDPWTHYKALELEEVKTKDVFVAPTIENGVLTSIYGHRIHVSYFINYAGVLLGTVTTDAYKYLANTAGKVDQDTEANNTTGTILAVRWDQWMLGWKRRMTVETTRIARADTTEIVALARWGLVYRDTEASAIGYNVTV